MELNFFVKGIILGFCIAAPVGPIGILCIRRTLQYGRFSGLVSGLGAAFADTLYGIITAFGLTYISSFLLAWQFWFQLFGGIFLFYLGLKTFYSKPSEQDISISHKNLIKDFTSTFFLTLSNPMTILAFLAVFTGLGLSKTTGSATSASMLVLGVFLGSALWWLILSEGITFFRKKISVKLMIWINRFAGLMICIFGLWALCASIYSRSY